ncbi:MAG: 16S rRNA (cytosine(1402)-N(4))-methyltransferase RsmH [Bryobacteraceae bacterium]
MADMHVSVMLPECLEYLAIRPDGEYLDVTCGMGGHTSAIAQRLTSGHVTACDRDAESLEMARENIQRNSPDCMGRIRFRNVPFSLVGEALAVDGVQQLDKGAVRKVDGLLADLGVSRYQLTDPERGFSLMADGPLDMRMDRGQGQTAADIVNYASEKELADLIYQLGEERRSRRIARAIVRARPVLTTGQLAKLIESAAPRMGKIHPATQTFMALRIAVNRENDELDALLAALPDLVKPGGRVVFLTFMSTEDRTVKRAFQELERSGRANILTRHVVRPSEEEVRSNPPSRSAKLRALEML